VTALLVIEKSVALAAGAVIFIAGAIVSVVSTRGSRGDSQTESGRYSDSAQQR
jgi:hypothetical protein